MNLPPSSSLLQSRPARIELARHRFFEEGQLPTGVVSDTVFESWARYVLGGEHFFDSVTEMHCAAAPIRDVRGRVAGVLDLSSERIPFAFDAAAVTGMFAGMIENRLLVAQSVEHLVIRFQVAADLLDSALVALVGIDLEGRLAWENGVARSLLGSSTGSAPRSERLPDASFGLPWDKLAALPTTGAAPVLLPNGLQVWVRVEMRPPDGRRGLVAGSPLPAAARGANAEMAVASQGPEADGPETGMDATDAAPRQAAVAATPRLRESDLDVIRKTLQVCRGNVSDAARRLGVSRGLIYRRLRESEINPSPPRP